MQRDDYFMSATTLTLVAGYIAVDLAFFASSDAGWLLMAAGLPIGLGAVWICSDFLAPSE